MSVRSWTSGPSEKTPNYRRLDYVSTAPSSPSVRKIDTTRGKPSSLGRASNGSPVGAGQSTSVDHWTMVLFYAMGVGALALAGLFFFALLGIGLYGQFIWTFTHWDLSSVRSEVVRPWAQFTLWAVFLGGTGVGIWFFGGYGWKNLNVRFGNAASRARR